jgi:hypothetical protein
MKFTQVESADGTILKAPSDGSAFKLRYSMHQDAPWNGLKKNTLLTFAEKNGRAIFFGIARCNLEDGDRFNRKRGRAIAASRLKQAIDEFTVLPWYNGFGLSLGNSMLYGVVPKTKVGDLLEHFKSIDEKVDAKRREKYPPSREDMRKKASA